MGFTKEDIELLKRHVSNIDKNIYVIYNLPPEVVAVLFAYVSRSPLSFRENLLKLIKSKDLDMGKLIHAFESQGLDYEEAKEKARAFHEKWVVGYGHSSIAEHAVASIAIENVSILASKVIEDNRLASYTEKSTRYQIFDKGKYYKPRNIMESEFAKVYEETCDSLFDFYAEVMPKMMEHMREKYPKPEDMPDRLYESITKARACDVVRYVLPASTLTNIGMTANARTLEHMIRKLLSHPLKEMNDIGLAIKEEVKKIIPTLVKYANKNDYIVETNNVMENLVKEMVKNEKPSPSKPVVLVGYDTEAENKTVASIIYKYSNLPYEQILKKVKAMSEEEKRKVINEYVKRMSKHDWPMRELEHVYYSFDILVDYGAFRDLQRHRMCTQTNQDVTIAHGFEMPKEFEEIGLGDGFTRQMESAKQTFEMIRAKLPKEAQYVVPLAFRKRTLFTINLRELHHLIKLRSSKEGHISYRRIAWLMHDEIMKVHPVLGKYIRIDRSEGPSRG